MGSSESKMSVTAEVKPEPAVKHGRLGQLMDPRSPSTGIDRTPIQVGGPVSKISAEVKSECPLQFSDPRSPTVGITRTPVREVMRATVGSFARRLGMLFHNESEDKVPQKSFSVDAVEENHKAEESVSSDPLLPLQCSLTSSSLAEHVNLLVTPVPPPPQSLNSSSPFVLMDDEPQVELEIETEADISLEEAEEARETPLHKRLSMSLITYHEGAASSFVFAEVHNDNFSSPVCGEESQSLRDGVDHSYALPAVISKPESPVEPSIPIDSDDSPVINPPTQPEEGEKTPSSEDSKVPEVSEDSPLSPTPSEVSPVVPSPEEPQICTRIRCPTIDPRSPSQVVFKPQWLGKGFGGTGQRARGVQNHVGKGGSSPLAVRVAVKNATNENKGQSGKLKQKGNEGRSPLQILKATNSPREQRSQKLKVSTPDKQRLGQMDRRVMTVSLDKENR